VPQEPPLSRSKAIKKISKDISIFKPVMFVYFYLGLIRSLIGLRISEQHSRLQSLATFVFQVTQLRGTGGSGDEFKLETINLSFSAHSSLLKAFVQRHLCERIDHILLCFNHRIEFFPLSTVVLDETVLEIRLP